MNSVSLRNLTDDELLGHVDTLQYVGTGDAAGYEALVMELAARLSRERTVEEECDARCEALETALEDFDIQASDATGAIGRAVQDQMDHLVATVAEALKHVRQ